MKINGVTPLTPFGHRWPYVTRVNLKCKYKSCLAFIFLILQNNSLLLKKACYQIVFFSSISMAFYNYRNIIGYRIVDDIV